MQALSVVIIARNEEHVIAKAISSAKTISNNIILADSGSNDNTITIATELGAQVIHIEWQGFGPAKHTATNHAAHAWVLSLDADEIITPALATEINSLSLNNINQVFYLKFRNHLGDQPIYHGAWGKDKHVRLFNKTFANWDNAPVHEQLAFNGAASFKTLNAFLHHQVCTNKEEYIKKTKHYAELMAKKYYQKGKRANWLRPYLSSFFTFIKEYIVGLGFLDGSAGWFIAKTNASYTFNKYKLLRAYYT
jgi:glycosyltransferase involved in cell wall biosynthesis